MKYYCIGIKGAGMSTLANILFDLGNDVSGYDDAKKYKYTEEGLNKRNIKIFYDEHPIDKDTIVTYSVAFNESHPEIQRVKALGLQVKKYNEIMGEIISMFDSIGVSGTHGKTTTASLIRHILESDCGCNYFIGAGDGYAMKENDYFVVESDEFNRHFTAYKPKYSVITNIEAEHLECYKDIDDIRNTFEIFANNTSKFIVANGDNTEVRKINYIPKDVEISKIYFADTETDTSGPYHVAFCIAYAEEDETDENFNIIKEHRKINFEFGRDCLTRFLDNLENNSLVYFHNLGYDIRQFNEYIINKECCKNTKVMNAEIISSF